MKLNFTGDISDFLQGIDILSAEMGYELSQKGISVEVEKLQKDIEVRFENGKGYIGYTENIHFFRALGILIENLQNNKEFRITETPQFKTNGAMFDFSRNAVMRISSFKKMLNKMAIMGLNVCMLYTEDTYTVEGEPYFGYMRGRYSYDELKELDDYAYSLGIEMIPCIQTLGHMEQFLKWEAESQYVDRRDILLADEEKTYELVEKMIRAASEPFRSDRIHVGMDEANDLGLGEYLRKFGFKNRFEIMNGHLKKIIEITDKYSLKPMIWSDMYFRLASKHDNYYDTESAIPQEVIDMYSKEAQLVYWDYYHKDEGDYRLFINKHKAFGAPPVFAGGIWSWKGIGTNYGATFVNTNAALKVCKEEQVKEVFATIWGDDGAENNFFSALLGLQLFAEHGYSRELDNDKLKSRFEFCTGVDYQAFMDLRYLDETPGTLEDNLDLSNPSKVLLWQDVLTGLFDKHVEGYDLTKHYTEWEIKYKEYRDSYPEYKFVFDVPYKLCFALKIKSEIGVKIKKAYDSKDMAELKEISEKQLPELKVCVDELRFAHRAQWMEINKPFGWEVLDIRYGGVITRIDTAIYRINAFLAGEIDKIEELEEERLFFDGRKPGEDWRGFGKWNQYSRIASASQFVHCMF